MKRLVRWVLAVSGPVLAVAWIVGWLGKDRSIFTIWFYFIPAPVAAAGLVALLVALRGKGWPAARWFTKAALGLMLLKILLVDCAWNRAATDHGATMRVVHWNAERGSRGVEKQFASLAGERADICVYSESPRKGDLRSLAQLQLGMPYLVDAAGMTLMSKYPCTPAETIELSNARGWVSRIATPQGPLDLVIVDIISHPLIDRFVPVQELTTWLDRHGTNVPVLVLGDFNTPRDSLSFERLRRRLRHGYEVAGSGWPYTWPVPLPVFAIDHAWFSPGVTMQRYRLRSTLLSDHRRQVMEIRL